jgi:hypothetical protein
MATNRWSAQFRGKSASEGERRMGASVRQFGDGEGRIRYMLPDEHGVNRNRLKYTVY